MNTLDRWLSSRQKQNKNFVPFYQALLSTNIFPYAWYKTRYFFYSQAISVVVNIIEFYLLTVLLGFQKFAVIVLLKAALLLISNTWWGALDVLRSRVRSFDHLKQRVRVQNEMNCWMVFGGIVGMLLILSSIYCIGSIFTHLTPKQMLLRTFIAVLILESSLNIIQQTYQAGVSTLQTLHRPFYSYWIPQVVYLSLLATSWPLFKSYALPVSYLFYALLNVYFLFYFTFHSCRTYNMPTIHLPNKQALRLFFKKIWSRELILASLANLGIGIEGLLIWLAFYSSFTNDPTQSNKVFFLLLYFFFPLLKTCSNWSTLFYYDFKKYAGLLKDFIQKFHAQLFSIALMIGVICWLVATAISLSYFGAYSNSYFLIFLFFFILKSAVSYLQIYAFCLKKYMAVIISNIFIITGFSIMFLLKQTLLIQLALLILFMSLGFLFIRRVRARSIHWSEITEKRTLQFNDWLNSLMSQATPVRLEKIKLSAITTELQQKTFLLSLHNKINKVGKVTLVTKQHIFYYVRADGDEPHSIEVAWLTQNGAGLIDEYKSLSTCKNGREALRLAYKEGFLLNNNKPDFFDAKLNNLNIDRLIQLFNIHFPYGKCIYKEEKKAPFDDAKHNNISHEEVTKQFMRFMTAPLDTDANAKQAVSMIHDKHQAPAVFIIPRAYENHVAIDAWAQLIYQYMIIRVL
jgi:hypothetical protein